MAEAQTLHVGLIHPDIQPEISSALLSRTLRKEHSDITKALGVNMCGSQEKMTSE